MAFVNLPEFTARMILTAAIMNQIITAMQGFSAQTGDLAWPMVAGGNIDFDSTHSIVNLRTFWNVVNASEYATLDAALSAVEAMGGGCLFVPPDDGGTWNQTSGISIDTSNIWIVGCGTDSVIELTSGAGPLFDTTASLSNIGFMNVHLKEVSSTGSADGIVFRRTTSPRLINVLFTGFDGDSVYYTNDGTPGNSSLDAVAYGLTFDGGGANGKHIRADDLDGMFMDQILSKSAGDDAIALEPASANCIIRDIQGGANIRVETPIAKGISILGASATADTKYSRIHLNGPMVVSPGGIGIEMGATAKLLQDSTLMNPKVYTPGGNAISVAIQRGLVSEPFSRGTDADTGLDINESDELSVQGGSLRNFDLGIDASGLTEILSPPYPCSIQGVDVRESVTEGVKKPESVPGGSRVECGGNLGDVGKIIGGTVYKEIEAQAGAGASADVYTYTIPADTLSKAGDGIVASVNAACNADGANGELSIKVDGTTVGGPASGDDSELMGLTLYLCLNAGPDTASNTKTWFFGMNSANATFMNDGTNTVDWTEDVTLIVRVVNGGAQDALVKDLVVRFFEGAGQ